MIRLLDKSEKLSQVAAWCSGLLLFLASVMIAIEVVLRKAFAFSIGGADELSSYALAISCTWGFSYALFRKSHIRIDVLYSKMPGTGRAILDLLAYGLLAVYIVTLSYFGFLVLKTSVIKHSVANTPLATPMWIPQMLWLLGLFWFGLMIFVILGTTCYCRFRGNRELAEKVAGISTLDEEIQETADVAITPEQNR
ncbi:MAG: TRAP transporter small permease [Desulfofustis sp.]|nr:TRAP transporter small permease [Desulfofustis sp.]